MTEGTTMAVKVFVIAFAAMFVLLTVRPSAHADSGDDSGTMFYASCMAADDVMEDRLPRSDPEASADRFEKASMCLGAVTALMNLEPFFKPEFGMCPPLNTKISYYQMVLVVTAYLKNHPEKLHENFHFLAALALHKAWPCPEGGR
jgi:hypothetical protein